MSVRHYIACDLGAESGRVILGSLDDKKLTIEEIHRFPNGPVEVFGSLRWDVLRLYEEIKVGLHKIAARGIVVAGISCDSWGVDYVLLGGNEPFLTVPYHYRDSRTDGAFQRAFATVSKPDLFEETGIQFMSINTLYQLLADLHQRPSILDAADRFLNVGDYFNYLLSGVPKAEESLASTTQVYNPRLRTWSKKIIEQFSLPGRIFAEIVPSGTILGPLVSELSSEAAFQDAKVIAGCSHDTSSAVAAVPAESAGWAYLSSGTWSLLGVENPKPVINAKSLDYNFTNEIGYGGIVRFLKNITGLWVLQECRRSWLKEGKQFSYEQLTQMAEAASPSNAFLDLMDERFGKPGDMPGKIADYCRETHQPVPITEGETVRCILSSLGLLYRQTLDQIEELTGRVLSTLHIVGGGCRNRLLNQLAADVTGRTVLAGPVECSAIGNVIVQAIALGHIPNLAVGREIVRDSFPLVRYDPKEATFPERTERQFKAANR
jgi:rhamnulokinase